MALAITGTGNGSLNNLALSANTGTIVDTGRAGGIIQVVTATTTTQTSTTSTSFVDTALSASITPTSSSNKVLVMVDGSASSFTSAGGTVLRIVRGSTELMYRGAQYDGSNTQNIGGVSIIHLDSPATTSATTYKLQILAQASSSQARFNSQFTGYAAPTANITLMEVVA